MRTNLIKTTLVVDEKPTVSTSTDGTHDMVIAFDTTGSMYSYLDAVKRHVKSLIPELLNANPKMRIGIVAFGDYCDMESAKKFGNAYQVIGLTNDANALINFVDTAKGTSGGDSDEFYELVIKKITEESDWREDAVKTVLLIADYTPHPVGYSYRNIVKNAQIDWREEARKANAKGIQFDTLSIYGFDWYRELSEMTNGVYAPFKSDTKTTEAVKMAAYSRGGEATKTLFMENVRSYAASADAELNAMSFAYSKKVSLSEEELSEINTINSTTTISI